MDITTSFLNDVSVSNWLNQFLTKRKHSVELGEPLFRFHMTREEYETLRQLLKHAMKYGTNHQISKEWYAGFTLYCSEWFRREYSLDWSWTPILQTLNIELTQAQRAEAVSRGLIGFWKRPLSKYQNSNNDYLGSLFREGGLPSNLLSNDKNHYQSAFYSIFERYQEIKKFGRNKVEELIEHRISRLPETLRSQDSVDLIANMVEQLDSLVYQFGLDKQTNPAAYLDAQMPKWRESFPLPLEDETGSAFLSQLLTRATDEVKKVAKVQKTLGCKHYLSFSNQSITSEITLPYSYDFNIRKELLTTSRIELAIAEGDQQIALLGTAYIQFENGCSLVRLRNAAASVRRKNADRELYIVAMQAGCKLAAIRLTGSAIDIGETPITLTDDGNKWRIIGQASVNVKQPKVGILLPTNAKIHVVHGEVTDTELSYSGLALKTLEGKCNVVTAANEKYSITTGAENLLGSNLILKGQQLPWQSVPPLVFKGIPVVDYESGAEQRSEHNNLESFLGDTPIIDMSRTEVNGRQLFTAKTKDGVILLRKRIGILPRDFDIEMFSGATPKHGIISVITSYPCVCTVLSEQIKVDSLVKKQGVTEIALSVAGMPPATVSIQIRAGLIAEPIVIDVPFPSKGAVAYNADGHTLAPNLAVEDLLGSRLHLFSTQGNPANFQLEAVAISRLIGSHKIPYFRWRYRVADKPVEVSLYGLKDSILELLSLTDDLDSEVELTVTGPIRPLRFLVSHYSTTLEHDKSNNTVYVSSKALLSSEKVKPVLISLSAPEQKPIMLNSRKSEGVATGEFELPSYLSHGGPWLVVPDRSSEVAFRAKFIPGAEIVSEHEEAKTLQKAAMCYHPKSNRNVISNVLCQMSEDWTHSGWQYLRNTYNNYSYLPLSTFEVWRHLVRNPRALAVALFKFENDEKLIAHLENELPVFWEFIPLKDWRHAVSQMKQALRDAGLPDPLVQQVCENQMRKLGVAIPALAETVVSYLQNGLMPSAIPAQLMKVMIQDQWYQDLLRQHSEDDHWPKEHSDEIMQKCAQLKQLPFEFQINTGYQAGVVFLPIFAAAVASGQISPDISKQFSFDAIFHFRKLRDFDREWFEPVYRCFIAYFANNS